MLPRTARQPAPPASPPLHRGEPGYDSHPDREGDGVACE
ncbi:excalibur calcium-binding domain-containing protein [Streptomyces sp. NPDC086777]